MANNDIAQVRAAQRSERMRNVAFILGFLLLVSALAAYALKQGATPADIALIGFVAFSAIVISFAAAVLWEIINGSIDLSGIISEPDGAANVGGQPKASLSRFQFLLFTFVVAGLFLMLSIEAGSFVNIPDNVLMLIGISGGGFIASKAVGHKQSTPSGTITPSAGAGGATPAAGAGGANPTTGG